MSRYISSSRSSNCRRGQVFSEAALEAALNQIIHSIINLDWQHFIISPRHTHIYRSIVQFDSIAFTDLVRQAFPVASAGLTQDEVLAVHNAIASLTEQLHRLEQALKQLEAAGLDIGDIGSSLTWLRRRTNQASVDLERATIPHPLYTDTVSTSPQHNVPRWGENQYVGPMSVPVHQSRSPPDVSSSAFNVPGSRTASQSIAAFYAPSPPRRTERKRTLTRPMTVRDDNQRLGTGAPTVTSYNAREKSRYARGYVDVQDEHEYSYFNASNSRSSTRWYPD